jgi:hypothetical protein
VTADDLTGFLVCRLVTQWEAWPLAGPAATQAKAGSQTLRTQQAAAQGMQLLAEQDVGVPQEMHCPQLQRPAAAFTVDALNNCNCG